MDKKTFNEIETRLLEVNKVVEKLDSSIRVAAFDFLKPYIFGGNTKMHPSPPPSETDESSSGDLAELVEKHGSNDKLSDNAKLLTAWWFSQYGSAPFSIKWVKETGASTGLTIPDAPDMTFRQAKLKGKSLYKALGT